MNPIISCTDFSKSSMNALKYAAAMAKRLKVKLIIFHVYDEPVIFYSSASLYFSAYDNTQQVLHKKLKSLTEKISKEFSITADYILSAGTLPMEIKDYTEHHRIGAVVMGIKGNNKIKEVLVGSNVTSIAGKLKCPMVVIPDNARYKEVKKLVYARDYSGKLSKHDLEVISLFNNPTSLVIDSLEINQHENEPVIFPKLETRKGPLKTTGKQLKGEAVKMYFNEVTDGIEKFVKKEKAQALAIKPKHHSFIYRLLHQTHTKDLAFQTRVPLLIIQR